jgi:hypothetical protein
MAAALYANQPVNFLSLDALSFHLPVSIGTVLSLSSNITYTNNYGDSGDTDGNPVIASVVVLAEINDVATGLRRRSNTFHYSFDLGSKVKKRVIPGESECQDKVMLAVLISRRLAVSRLIFGFDGLDRGKKKSRIGSGSAQELPQVMSKVLCI